MVEVLIRAYSHGNIRVEHSDAHGMYIASCRCGWHEISSYASVAADAKNDHVFIYRESIDQPMVSPTVVWNHD